MNLRFGLCTLLLTSTVWGANSELSHRLAFTGVVLRAAPGQMGGKPGHSFSLSTADQQSLRTMWRGRDHAFHWQLHTKLSRLRASEMADGVQSGNEFRLDDLGGQWYSEGRGEHFTQMLAQVDQGWITFEKGETTVSLGRQPIDYGAGRLWQPMNVYGAFSPTELDTEYKPGIDALRMAWFPSSFSSLEGVIAGGNSAGYQGVSGTLHYQTLLMEDWEGHLLLGRLFDVPVVSASLEGQWSGLGWRIELSGLHRQKENFWSSLLGMDYRFAESSLVGDTTLVLEWYHHSQGAHTEQQFVSGTALVIDSLKPQMSRDLLGLFLEKPVTPLVTASYLAMAGPVKSQSGRYHISRLQQLNLRLSTSNESEAVLSMAVGGGPALNIEGRARSEFGAIPAGFTLQWRSYF